MLQVFANKISQNLSPKELTSHSWRSQQGVAIFWIIAIIAAFAVLGSAIVANYNVSLFGQIDTGLSLRAESMAASGYRFFYSEYNSQTSDVDKNKRLDDLHGKTFNIAPDGKGGQFQLNMTSYFYRVETVTSGSQLKAKFIGTPGFTVPTSGYLRNIEDATLYGYDSYSSAGDVYTFNLTGGQTVPSTALYTTVLPAADIASAVDNGDETFTLTLGSGQGVLFPPEKGMFLITKDQIKANLPVKQVVPYYYEYRSGDQLFKVTKGPGLGDLIDPTTADKAEVAKFVELKSIGYAPTKANFAAQKINNLQISLDISASSTWHSSTGLKSYWNFDDAGARGKDDYGTSDGTLTGGVTGGTGIVGGGGLEFDVTKTGYVSTTFNPSLAIGSDNEFTVTFWAKPGSDITTRQGIMGVFDDVSSSYFFIGFTEGYWAWGLGSDTDFCASAGCSTTLPTVTADQWQHVAFVYDGSDVILYINGVKEYSKAHSGPATMPNYNIYLGALYDPNTSSNIYGFTGSLDEVAVFNSALTFCEASAIFNVAATLPCNVGCDAAAYYPFNGNADDESGSNRDGNPSPGYDGTASGATLTDDQCGDANQAYYFDGSDYINTSFNARAAIGDGNPFTVAFWAKPDQVTALKAAVGAFNISQERRFYVAVYEGDWLWGYGSSNGLLDCSSLPVATADEWAHLGFVYDNATGKIRFYLNGVEHICNYTGDGVLPNFNVYVGARNIETGIDSFFTGIVDEVLIWNEAKTSTYMLDLYDGTKP
ncbi:LamG domain-containing protein [Thermodesulfobacteriota bacterium]